MVTATRLCGRRRWSPSGWLKGTSRLVPRWRIARSRRCGCWSRPGSSRAWPGWSGTSAWPRSWPRTRWSPRWNSGLPRASRPTRSVADAHRQAPGHRPDPAERTARQQLNLLGRELEAAQQDTPAEFDEEKIDDDLLRLMFIACHLVLSTEARVA